MEFLSKGIGGIKWVSIGRFSRQLIQFFTSIFLARILLPEDFGVVSLGLIFFGFLTTFRDFGIGSAIIYIEKLDKDLFSTAYLINFFLSFTISLLTYFFASQIVWALSPDLATSERLLPIIKFFSALFLFNGLTSLQQSVMERELLFNKLAIIEIIATLIGAISAIVIGVIYENEWSLIAQISVTLIINGSLTFLFSPYKPSFTFNRSKMKEILAYSSHLSGYSFINYLVRNADYFLIGKFLGSTSLGYYTLAYRIILYPIINISNVFSRVMLPIYARLKNDLITFRTIFKLVSFFIYLVVLPYFIVLIIFSEEFVSYILSTKWSPIIDILIILIPVGIIQASSVTTGSIYQALGKTKELLRWGLFSGSIFIFSFIVGINFGVLGVAISYMAANIVLFYFWFKIPFKFIDQSVSDFTINLKNIFGLNFIIATIAFLSKHTLNLILSDFVNVLTIILLVLIMYVLAYLVILKKEIYNNYLFLKGTK